MWENIIKELKVSAMNQLNRIEEQIAILEHRVETLPEGKIKTCTRKGGFTSVYYCYENEEGKTIVDRYLSKAKDSELIKKLAQKQYYSDVLTSLKNEQKSLSNMCKSYKPEEKYKVYEGLVESRKQYITNLYNTPEKIYEKWCSEPFLPYEEYKQKLIHRTDRGELVRSKSEVIIANKLYQYKDVIYYKYEAPLYLKSLGEEVRPDFTIMRKKDAKIFYWEHEGMLDTEKYANKNVRKINGYIKDGIIPGDKLILTFETSEIPVDIECVERLIQGLI